MSKIPARASLIEEKSLVGGRDVGCVLDTDWASSGAMFGLVGDAETTFSELL